MKPVWKFILLVADAILSAVKVVFGGNTTKLEK